jgi:hypothetical protein
MLRCLVSHLKLDHSCLPTDKATGVWSSAEVKDFSSSLCVQTNSESHPASYLIGTAVPFLGAKVAGAWRWALTQSSAEIKNE